MPSHLSWRYRRLLIAAQRIRTSIALRGWRGTVGRISQQFVRRPPTDDSLSLVPDESAVDALSLPTSPSPRVSVIIPVFGKLDYTLTCLRSMALSPPTVPFEVVVVDDASPDHSADTLERIPGIRFIRNASNLGFVGSCNAGVHVAKGEFLVFLNNDTQVRPGWIEELLRCFALRPDCGIAGSQLVYPDGRLQEAGAWLFSDASAWNTGRFESRHNPAVRYAREVDYVSGASLAIPRDLFVELGGFDDRYAPGYYEDADLAFAARAVGRSVWYVPTSVVVHAEGISSSGATENGMKRFQDINRKKFAEKWLGHLSAQAPPGTSLAQVAERRYCGTILVVDVAAPDASRDSGSLRLITMMRLLAEDDWHVVFAPDDGVADNAVIDELGRLGIETIVRPWTASVPTWLSRNGANLSAAILCRHTVAAQYAGFVRKYAPHARLLFDTVDLHFLREQRAAERAGSAALSRHALATRKQELALIENADTTFVVSTYERDLLTALMPQARVALLSNIHTVFGRARGYIGRGDVMFIGGYGHPPNADAMAWMAEEIAPALRKRFPGIRVWIAGDVPDEVREKLGAAGLDMLGRVDDLTPLMSRCLASIAPLRFGAGVKGKVNMAMSHGLPVIGTSVAVEGMHLEDGLDVLVADDAEAFANAYASLCESEALWLTLSDHSLAHVAAHFSADAALATLRQALR